jgi:hypothetical protein
LARYELIYWYDDFITQLPFELKLTMPPTDKGGRGYSDELVARAIKELQEEAAGSKW